MRNLNENVEKYLKGFTPLEIPRSLNGKKRFLTGFTLMETMIVVSIFSLLMGTALLILVTGQRAYDRQEALMGIRFEAKRAMNRMVSELRNTGIGQIYILDAAGAHVLTDIPGSPLRLRFQLPVDWDSDGDVLDQWGNIEWGEPSSKKLNWAAEYALSGNNLVRRVYNGLASTALVQPIYETVLAGLPEDPIRPILITSLLTSPPLFQGLSLVGSADNLALVEINLTARCSTLKGLTLSSPLTASLRSKIKFRN